jgi:hypothetical protein
MRQTVAPVRRTLARMLFAAVGVATALIYVAWVVWVPMLPSNLYIPLLDLGKITGYTWSAASIFMAIVGALYALYALGYRLVSRGSASTWGIFLFGAVFCVALIGAYPATAVDVFAYVAHGRLVAEHHANPFIVPPDAYPTDAIVPYLAFPGEPSQYGPAWVLLGDALATIAHGDLLTEVVLYKLVGALAHLGGGAWASRTARPAPARSCSPGTRSCCGRWSATRTTMG